MESETAQWGKIGKRNLGDFCYLLCHFDGKYVSIGLKAPGNYSDQFWSNTILVLLCEGPKPNISMIDGLLTPGEPVFMDINIPKYFKRYKKNDGHIFETYDVCKYGKLEC